MWAQGELYRREHGPMPNPLFGVYSLKMKDMIERGININNQELCDNRNKSNEDAKVDNVLRILKKVDTMKLDDQTDENKNNGINTTPQSTVAANILKV